MFTTDTKKFNSLLQEIHISYEFFISFFLLLLSEVLTIHSRQLIRRKNMRECV